MLKLIGIVVVLGSVFGGFVLSHGDMRSLWQPFELLIIGGAAIGTFIISNPPKVIRGVMQAVPQTFSASPYSTALFLDLLAMLYELFNRWRREGVLAIEADIDNPDESELFERYPRIYHNEHAMTFILDYMRIIASGNMSAFELETLMDTEIENDLHELEQPGHAVTQVADALPGFGIVAAVLGIVITMKSLGGPPELIGEHVAAALVGTFLGILMAYGFVGPLGSALTHIAREEIKIKECIKTCMLAMVNGVAPQMAVEFGRKVLLAEHRPTFSDLEEHIRGR